MKKYLHIISFCISTGILISPDMHAQVTYKTANLNINNVDAQFSNILTHFIDPINGLPRFIVPSSGTYGTVFASNFWISAYDPGMNLHVAAQTYNQMNAVSYYPGPLDISNGTAADTSQWNLIWKVNKSTIQNHIANWNTPGYIVPAEIADWPGNAPSGSNFNPVLAPFFDSNGNSLYEPALGEFPSIFGDQAIYFICNDNYAPSQLGAANLGVEIHGMAYAFSDPGTPSLDNTVFIRYQVANYSGLNYNNLNFGFFNDFDLGDAADDYMGTDVPRNMTYVYNANATDAQYGANPPATGFVLLSNTLSNSLYPHNVNGIPNGNAANANDYNNLMHGTWLDGLHQQFGGDGYSATTGGSADYAFPGLTDPAFPGQDWSCVSSLIMPDDVRATSSVNGLSLPAGGYITIDAAFVTAFGSSGPQSSVALLQNYADDIGARYANGSITGIDDVSASANSVISIYPTLVSDLLHINFKEMNRKDCTIEILSADGKLLMKEISNGEAEHIIDVRNLQAGFYFCRVNSVHGSVIEKFMHFTE